MDEFPSCFVPAVTDCALVGLGLCRVLVFREDGIAERHAFIADVHLIRSGNQVRDLLTPLAAEGTCVMRRWAIDTRPSRAVALLTLFIGRHHHCSFLEGRMVYGIPCIASYRVDCIVSGALGETSIKGREESDGGSGVLTVTRCQGEVYSKLTPEEIRRLGDDAAAV